jgi:hypothetical protein
MIEIPQKKSSLIANRFTSNLTCRKKFKKALELIDISSVPEAVRVDYKKFIG